MTEYAHDLAYFGGDEIFAADLQAILDRLPRTILKTSATARNSAGTGSTLTADPELSGIALEVGVYDLELILFWTCANTTPRLKTRWGFTGTISNTIRLCHGPGASQVGGPEAVSDATLRGYALTTQDAVYSTSTSSAYSAVLEQAFGVEVTVAGDLSLDWAQQASNANNVTVQADSAFRVRRIQ